MERFLEHALQSWATQESAARKPLIVRGARQVGKTYTIREFGKAYKGRHFHSFDFRADKSIRGIFSKANGYDEGLQVLETLSGRMIDKDRGLVFFDEIQDAPGALSALKYAKSDHPNLAIIAAGSHLGMTQNEEPFPVGAVEFLNMSPMSFSEFLLSADPGLHEYYRGIVLATASTQIPSAIHDKLFKYLRAYFVTGGMPEVVRAFLDLYPDNMVAAYAVARKLQNNLIEGYKADFSKYSGTVNAAHILDVFENIPMQLGRALDEEVGKFKFSDTTHARHRGFAVMRGTLTWLVKARLCIRCRIANRAEIPLKAFTKESRFKLYLFDVGILAAMLDIPATAIVGSELGSYKGYIVENFLAQELFAYGKEELFAWSEGRSEIEFLLFDGVGLVPIEAKASSRSRRAKSLEAYLGRYPNTHRAYKVTGQNIGVHSARPVMTLPLYLAGKLAGSW